MKKTKKLFAVLLTLAMVMGMSITTFADVTPTTITVTNVDAGSTVTYEQIIVPAPDEETGWAFAAESTAVTTLRDAIKAVEINSKKTDQEIIAGLIVFANGENAKLPAGLKASAAEIDATLLQTALNTAALEKDDATKDADGNYKIPASSAGVYVIHATDTTKKEDPNDPDKVTKMVTYSPMAAYVSFNYASGGAAETLVPVTVNAKKQDLTLTKEDNEADKVTAVHDVVQYTLKTTVPYIPDDVTNDKLYFNIVDMIKGARYVSNEISVVNGPAPEDMEVAEKIGDSVAVTVKLDGETRDDVTTAKLVTAPDGFTYSFALDLKDIAGAVDTATGRRLNANKSLEITYKAYVTSTVIDNKAHTEVKTKNDQETPTPGPEDDDKLYTGTLKITKKGENNETLANAKFALYYVLEEAEGATKYYATVREATEADKADVASGVPAPDYIVTGWVAESEDLDLEERTDMLLTTKSDGTVAVKGLEDDPIKEGEVGREYFFKEVVAPEGYTLNGTDAGIDKKNGWTNREDESTANARLGETEMLDTKLSSLPSTGGIGTTIFTIGGCLIMIMAAGLFFATRRKSAK